MSILSKELYSLQDERDNLQQIIARHQETYHFFRHVMLRTSTILHTGHCGPEEQKQLSDILQQTLTAAAKFHTSSESTRK